MSFLKHVGKIGDRKVAVIFREVPGEPHMCLVTYTETLNRHIHDPMMKCIESSIGQQSDQLGDALGRTHTNDGKYILNLLHHEGLIKKVQTSSVVMTPNSQTRIKLDELNKMMNEMKQGEDAVRRMAELDASRGIHPGDPKEVERMLANQPAQPITASSDGVLGDNFIANNLLQQSQRMAAEAKGLLAESARLEKEANDMLGIPTATQTTTTPTAKKRGRPFGAKSKATTA